MTVEVTTNRINYTGNGVTTDFDFPFKYFNASDLQVYVDGALVNGDDYTVTANASGEGGTVAFDTAPAEDAVILIVRALAYTQGSRVPIVDKLGRGLLENIVDKNTMLIQQVKETTERSAALPTTYVGNFDPTLPETLTAGRSLQINDAGTGFELSDSDVDAVVALATAQAVAAAASENAAAASAAAAAVSAAAALASENGAATFANNADLSAETAQDWAEHPEDDTVPGYPGSYSALHWAAKAADSAAEAASVIPSATTAVEGKVFLADVSDVLAGTDTSKAVTPDALAGLWEKGSDISSAAFIIPATGGGYFTVTGTTTILNMPVSGSLKTGRIVRLRFEGALTLTHNPAEISLPGGANITTAAGDIATFVYDTAGGGNWKCVSYTRANGQALVGGAIAGNPKGYINGPAPDYTSASTVTFKAGLKARDSANAADIELTADVPVSLASAGAAGLDSGSEAANTWYYYYLIRKSGDGTCSVMASTVNESVTGSITMPSGYDQKRQLPFCVKNDGSSNIIPFAVGPGWPFRPMIRLRIQMSKYATAGGVTTFQNGSASASWTTHDLSAYMPPCSREVFVQAINVSAANTFLNLGFRPLGSSVTQGELVLGGDGTTAANGVVTTNSSQQIEIARVYGAANSLVDVMGYTITEIN